MKMIDIAEKRVTVREAVVEGRVSLKPEVALAVKENRMPKGNVLEAAKIAGILGAKKTPDIIPLCHPIPLDSVYVEFDIKEREIIIKAAVKGTAKTGVEMEAFAAVSLAALTIYDMCKMMDREMIISDIKLIRKTGGKTGDFRRK